MASCSTIPRPTFPQHAHHAARDYLQGDVYFNVNHRGHNLRRAPKQFAVVKSIENQAEAITRIVETVIKRMSKGAPGAEMASARGLR